MRAYRKITELALAAACALPFCAPAPAAAGDFVIVSSVTVNGAGNTQDQGIGLDIDAAGNIYTVGNVCTGTGVPHCYNIWIAKYSPDLVLIASRTVNGSANGQDTGEDIDVDAAGNVWVTGEINQAGTYMDIWVAKYDSDLNLLISTTINGANSSSADIGRGIHASSAGAVYVTGNIQDHIWIGKFDQALALVSSRTVDYGVQYDYGFDVKTDAAGNLWATGQVFRNITSEDIWVGKLTPELVVLASAAIHGDLTASDGGRGLSLDAAGNAYVTGSTGVGVDDGLNVYIAKLSSSAVLLASATFSGYNTDIFNRNDMPYRNSLAADGSLLVAGYVNETGQYDNFWTARYSPDLQLLSSASFNGAANSWDRAYDIQEAPSGAVYAIGYRDDAVGGQNIWLVKFGTAAARVLSPPGTPAGAVLGVSSVAWTWNAGGVAAADGYRVYSATGAPLADVPFGAGAWTQTGLAPNTPASIKVAAYNAAGDGPLAQSPTWYTFAAVPDGVVSVLVPGTSAVYSEWDDLANPPGTAYQVWRATSADFAAPHISTVTASPTLLTGLEVNTRYYGRARALNGDGLPGGFTGTAFASTLANPPAGLGAAVHATSAAVTWQLNGNPAGTEARLLRRSAAGAEAAFALSTNAYTDTGLLGCTSYYYYAWNLNRDGVPTSSAAAGPFFTGSPMPAPPGGLFAEPLAGGRIRLAWEPAPFEGIAGYNLYWDAGAGSVNYAAAYQTFGAADREWTTGPLASSAAYRFALRAAHRCGAEEANTSVTAAAPAGAALAAVRAAIKIPQTGRRVNGNSVTVMAELVSGTPAAALNVRLQYKASASAAWLDIPPAGANHPNPDPSFPYFVHWDVTALAAGPYDLRAVAADLAGAPDPAPAAITIIVDAADPEIVESTQAAGGALKQQKVSNLVDNTLQAGDPATAQVTILRLPAGALDGSTATVSVTNSPPAAPPPPPDAEAVGVVTEISLGGQTQLAAGQAAAVTLMYPDADGDGVVDGTGQPAARLVMYSAASAAGPWQADLGSSVDAANRKVTGHTTHFSYFALFGPVAAGVSSARAYPVPWRPGSGGEYDSPAGVTGILFDNLPAACEVKIFNAAGQLVRGLKVTAADGGYKAWDGLNDAGAKAGSGVYLAYIKAGSKTKVLKVAIER